LQIPFDLAKAFERGYQIVSRAGVPAKRNGFGPTALRVGQAPFPASLSRSVHQPVSGVAHNRRQIITIH
jgi:hypothetical protein